MSAQHTDGPWVVTWRPHIQLPHLLQTKSYYFADEGQASMFLHHLHRGGESATIAKAKGGAA